MPLTSHCCAVAYHQQWQWLRWGIMDVETASYLTVRVPIRGYMT
jgi:hypothetical protein